MRYAPALLVSFVMASPAAAQTASPPGAATSGCAALTLLQMPDVKITAATPVAPDTRITVPHCKATGVIGREIGFEVLLPDAWNERFVMGGGGGFVGQIDNHARTSINAGYATAGSDTGHQADGLAAGWAHGRLDRLVNYAHVAIHRTTEVAKAIVRAYYGRPARFDYFFGCSNGGRQALMEAQRYPEDFDGIVSGAPALNFTNIGAAFIRNAQALYPNAAMLTAPVVTADNLTLLAAKVMETCDAADRVKDGVIDDPRTCRFTPDTLPACPGDRAAPTCVTGAQRAAIARIYAPVVAGGRTIYPGQPFGGEAERGGWRAWITGPIGERFTEGRPPSMQWAFGTEMFKYFVFGDPAWDYTRYDLATWATDTKMLAATLNAESPDLDAFRARQGKLLLWHGWSDAALNAVETIRYHDAVAARNPAARDSMRLFMLPGVQHCGGGAGPDSVDWIGTLAAWVEKGERPERVVATKLEKNAAVRTRPVCAYPQRAVYDGTGNPDAAASFVCKAP
jgi:hypothetical protein